MEKLQITKGNIITKEILNEKGSHLKILSEHESGVGESICNITTRDQGRATANAFLITDAFNTYHSEPTLPSELLRQNMEMKKALEKLIPNMQGYAYEYHKNHRWFEFHFKDEIELLKTITSCNKGKE